ncbi:MAG: hypothetical protein M0Q44_01450 [Methylobacter sp.]|jgi:hypothetical protein|nr:hypothetical protein [Methylobacter sp.]
MHLTLSNGKPIRGDLIKLVVLRYDMSPVPATLEAEIRVDDELRKLLADGKTINCNGDDFHIVKPAAPSGNIAQGQHDMGFLRITALLNACHAVTFVRQRAIIKENVVLSQIYRASGATLRGVDGDFKVDRFNCMVGGTPSFKIAQLLQEEGGIVCWKGGKLKFMRLPDLFKQKPVLSMPDNASENIISGFLERHEIPSFHSLSPTGEIVHGNRDKARSSRFVPHKNEQQLINMSRCLVQRKIIPRMDYNDKIYAGDVIEFIGAQPLVVVTAAHVFCSGTDGGGSQQYTKLWLSGLVG